MNSSRTSFTLSSGGHVFWQVETFYFILFLNTKSQLFSRDSFFFFFVSQLSWLKLFVIDKDLRWCIKSQPLFYLLVRQFFSSGDEAANRQLFTGFTTIRFRVNVSFLIWEWERDIIFVCLSQPSFHLFLFCLSFCWQWWSGREKLVLP